MNTYIHKDVCVYLFIYVHIFMYTYVTNTHNCICLWQYTHSMGWWYARYESLKHMNDMLMYILICTLYAHVPLPICIWLHARNNPCTSPQVSARLSTVVTACLSMCIHRSTCVLAHIPPHVINSYARQPPVTCLTCSRLKLDMRSICAYVRIHIYIHIHVYI